MKIDFFMIALSSSEKENLLFVLHNGILAIQNGNYAGRNAEWIKTAQQLYSKIEASPISAIDLTF